MSHTARGVVVSECLHHHDLGPRLVMDFDLRSGDPCTLATGIGHTCNIMQLKSDGGARKKVERYKHTHTRTHTLLHACTHTHFLL